MKRTFGWLMTAVLAGGVLGTLSGCKPSKAVREGQVVDNGTKPVEHAAPPLDPATLGSISGTVHFAGKAPERIKIDMSQDPVCEMTGGDNYTEQYVVKDGDLANVYVYVKSGPAAAMSAPPVSTAPVVLDQVGCKYVPHVIAVMQGESIEFKNSDATMHNIHTIPTVGGNPSIDVSQGANGPPQTKTFDKPAIMMSVALPMASVLRARWPPAMWPVSCAITPMSWLGFWERMIKPALMNMLRPAATKAFSSIELTIWICTAS